MQAVPASQMKEVHPSKDNISKWGEKAKGTKGTSQNTSYSQAPDFMGIIESY